MAFRFGLCSQPLFLETRPLLYTIANVFFLNNLGQNIQRFLFVFSKRMLNRGSFLWVLGKRCLTYCLQGFSFSVGYSNPSGTRPSHDSHVISAGGCDLRGITLKRHPAMSDGSEMHSRSQRSVKPWDSVSNTDLGRDGIVSAGN